MAQFIKHNLFIKHLFIKKIKYSPNPLIKYHHITHTTLLKFSPEKYLTACLKSEHSEHVPNGAGTNFTCSDLITSYKLYLLNTELAYVLRLPY